MSKLFITVMREVSDVIYQELFGGTGDELRSRLGLQQPDTLNDDNLRDHMGSEALRSLGHVEASVAIWLKLSALQIRRREDVEVLKEAARRFASLAARRDRSLCEANGRDYLTGRRLQ